MTPMMRLGISSYTFGWAVQSGDFDENTLIDKALEMDVSLVQFGDNLPLHQLSTSRLNALAARAERESITIETGARRLTPNHLQTYLEISRRLNATLLRFVVDDGDYEPTSEEIIHILAAASSQAGNITIGIENHDRLPAASLAHTIQTVDSDNIGICLDTANSLGAGEGLAEVLLHLAPHTVNLHIKDFTIQRVPYLMGFTIEGRPAGDGMMNLSQLISQLDTSRCATAVLELWTPPEKDPSSTIAQEQLWAKKSLTYLRGLNLFR